MRVPILILFLEIYIFQNVEGDMKDFIISDENDLKRFEGEDSELMDDLDMYDPSNEMDMYDSCNGGDAADKYLHPYEHMTSEDDDFSLDALNNVLSESEMTLSHIKETFRKLAQDPRYAQLLEQVGGLDKIYASTSYDDESYTDVLMNNNEVC